MDNKRRHGLWQGMKKWLLEVFTPKPGRNRPVRVTEKRRGNALVLEQPVPEKPPAPGLGARLRQLVEIIEVLAFGLGFIAIASLVLGIFAFTRPVRHDVPVDLKYQQTGTFSYSGTAPNGVYDTGRVTSGEPIFPDLTCAFNLQFIYTITGRELAGLNGTHHLVATVEENTSHWTRTIPLEAKTAFSGNTFGADVPVNLCFIQTIVTSMEEKTTLQPNFYSLTISPSVTVAGKISGLDFQDTLQTPLVMQFDKVHTYIFNTDPTVDPLNSEQEGAVASTREEENTLSLFGIKAPVSKLRTISVIGLSVSGIVLLVLGIYLSTSARRSQQAYMQMKYGSILVDVQNPPLDAATPVTDVVTLDDLVRLAERFNTLILHETRGHGHFYYVQGDRITYRYTVNEAGGGGSSGEEAQ